MSDLLLNKTVKIKIAGEEFTIQKLTYAKRLKAIGLLKGPFDSQGNLVINSKSDGDVVAENVTEFFCMLLGKDKEWVENNIYQEDANAIFQAFDEVSKVPFVKGEETPK